jgi:hypothetical protein
MRQDQPVNVRKAERLLDDEELVALASGSMSYIKELVARCLDADIPAMVGRPPGSGKS